MSDDPKVVTVTMRTQGYESSVQFPIGTDPADAFLPWLDLQMSWLRRWVPGVTADLREHRPLPSASLEGGASTIGPASTDR